jgi:hypothetical protein
LATTRTPLQPAPFIVAYHSVGFEAFAIRYLEGQEDLARESIARYARNPDYAFSWNDAASMGEQIPAAPLGCDVDCNCDACIAERHFEEVWDLRIDNARLWWWFQGAKTAIGLLLATVALLICRSK